MHSDILEFFVIYQSVPVFIYGKPSLVDEVLKAGRISIQAILGREATGEEIQMEILSDSYIVYDEFDDFLIALRARKTISPQGAKKILNKVKRIVIKNKKIIKRKLGSLKSLRHIERLIDLTLGESVLSTPQGLMELDSISDSAMKNIKSLVSIILITNESWPIYVLYKDVSNPPKLNQEVWRNAVENIYNSLEEDCKIDIRLEKNSIFILKKIILDEEEEWWVLIAQGKMNNKIETMPFISELYTFFENVETLIFNPGEKVIKEMVKEARKYWGMKGILSEPIKLVSLEKGKAPTIQPAKTRKKIRINKKFQLTTLETKETIGKPLTYELVTETEKIIFTLRELPIKILNALKENKKIKLNRIEFETANISLDEAGTRYMMSTIEWIAEQFTNEIPLELYIGIEPLTNPRIHLPRIRNLTTSGIFVHLFTSDSEIKKKAMQEGIHTVFIPKEIGIELFFFNLLVPVGSENNKGLALILYNVPDGAMRGIISIDPDIVSITRGRLEEIEREENG